MSVIIFVWFWMKSFITVSLTCSENSATSIKSLRNWAVEDQGLSGGAEGTDSSSGRPWPSWSSSPSPNPSVPVKASRSGDPIIFRRRWGGSSHEEAERRRPAAPGLQSVSQLLRPRPGGATATAAAKTNNDESLLETCCAVESPSAAVN